MHTPLSLPGGRENFDRFVNFGPLFFFIPLSLRPTAPSSSGAPSLPRRRVPATAVAVVATGGWKPVSAESVVEEVTASTSDKSFAACATLVSSRSRRSSFSFLEASSSASRRRLSRSRAAMRERRASSNGSSVWWTTVDRASAAVAAVRRPSSSVTASTTIDRVLIALAMVRNLSDRMALTAAVSSRVIAGEGVLADSLASSRTSLGISALLVVGGTTPSPPPPRPNESFIIVGSWGVVEQYGTRRGSMVLSSPSLQKKPLTYLYKRILSGGLSPTVYKRIE